MLFLLTLALAAAPDWHGYEKREFTVDGINGYVVLPKATAPGRPWLWRARFPEFHPEYAVALLGQGFHVAYYDQPNVFGSPRAVAQWDRFYAHVRAAFGLSARPALEGVSRGGLFVYNWAVRNPEKVSVIYAESPVCDLKSWPGGRGKGRGSPKDWQEAIRAYGFTTEAELLAWQGNPLDHAERLAAARIPILHLVNERDEVVPPAENTWPFAERYRRAGGSLTVHLNTRGPETLFGHHFPLDDIALPVNFILAHTPGLAPRAGRGITPHGVEYFELRHGLPHALAKMQNEATARVAFLGGSITQGGGWRDLVCASLRRQFPKTAIDCVNAGLSSTGSTPGAFRLRRDAFGAGPVDLLFVEAAVNDATNGFAPREQVRGMEGIVRQARLLHPSIDIVMLHFADPDKLASYRRGETPEVIRSHERVAAHYGLPSLHLAREVTERIDAGEFTWEKDFVNLHPSPFGHTVYHRSILRLFDAAGRVPTRPAPLPTPLDEKSYFRGRLVDVGAVEGWTRVAAWEPTDGAATRPGFVKVPMLVAARPGETARFRFEGTAVGLFAVAGPDAGTLEFSIDGGPFRSLDLFTAWSARLHLPWAYVLDADLAPGPHEVTLRASARQHPQSKGTAIRVAHLLVN